MKKLLIILLFTSILVGCGIESPKVQVNVIPPKEAIVQANDDNLRILFRDDEPRDIFELTGSQFIENRPRGTLDDPNLRIVKLKDKENGNLIYLVNSGNGVSISVVKP